MTIRKSCPADLPRLLEIWEDAVRATHHFLSESDIQNLHQQLELLYLPQVPIWLHENATNQITGFIGIDGNKIEMLFVDPTFHGQGIGTQLLDFFCQSQPEILIDVNEDNPKAHQFYLHYGFKPIGYSECDPEGRPFPVIHMQLVHSASPK